jgi:hypothetical protein
MTWPIHFVERPPLHPMQPDSFHYDGSVDFSKLAVGDLCFYHHQGKPCTDSEHLGRLHLTAYYFMHNAGRPPLILALPDAAFPNGKLYFLVDGQCYSGTCTKCGKRAHKNACAAIGGCTPKGYYDAWTVTGTPPLITVAPSINYDDPGGDGEPPRKHYHGFVQNGIMGDPL